MAFNHLFLITIVTQYLPT